jgi:hypothetical protein
MSPDIGSEVMDELLDPKFDTLTHGKKYTFTKGCRGPLCKKAERDVCAARYRRRKGNAAGPYKPRYDRPDEWLQEMMEWHWSERAKLVGGRSLREYYGVPPLEEALQSP